MADLSRIAIDTQKAAEGVWVVFLDDIRLKIARWNNPTFRKVFQREQEAQGVKMKLGLLSIEEDEQLANLVMGEAIVLAWENLEDEGEPVKYSPKEAARLLGKYTVLREFVAEQAKDLENFKAARNGEIAKNS